MKNSTQAAPLVFVAAILNASACHEPSDAGPSSTPAATNAPPAATSAVPRAATSRDGGTHPRGAQVEAIVRAWNVAINTHDADKLGAMYGDEIELYGQRVARAKAVALKKAAFADHVRDDVTDVAVMETGRATFHKKSKLAGGKVIEVLAYLDLQDGKIVSEGDTTTDQNLARAHEVRCEDAVLALVRSTAEAVKAMKDIEDAKNTLGPVTAGVVVHSPAETGAGWWVRICESFPDETLSKNRMPCFVNFGVNSATAVVTDDEGKPLEAAPALAAKVKSSCK
jgi:hypothetical protein